MERGTQVWTVRMAYQFRGVDTKKTRDITENNGNPLYAISASVGQL